MKRNKKVLPLSLVSCLLMSQTTYVTHGVMINDSSTTVQTREKLKESSPKHQIDRTVNRTLTEVEGANNEKTLVLDETTETNESQNNEESSEQHLVSSEQATATESNVPETPAIEITSQSSAGKTSENKEVETKDSVNETKESDTEIKVQKEVSTTVTVNFIVDGKVFDSQEIEKGTIPRPPKLPTSSGQAVFVGWYVNKGNNEKELYNFSKPLEKDTELHAEFREQYTIMFKVIDQVVETVQLDPKAAIKKPSSEKLDQAVENASDGKVFSYWYDESDPEQKQIVFGVDKVVTDMVLVPKYSDRYTVTYITNGEPLKNSDGTNFENPQFLDRGGKIKKPPVDPKRQGYTFKYWSLDQSGATPFNFDTQGEINENTVLYAIYEASKGVSFYIQYWNEKSNIKGDAGTNHANYDAKDKVYVPYNAKEWPTGVAPRPDEELELPQSIVGKYLSKNTNRIINDTIAEFSHYESQVLSSTGDTVINVFYKRSPQKLNFIAKGGWFSEKKYKLILNVEGKSVALDGTKSDQSTYTMKAKIGEKLVDIWPEVEEKKVTINGKKEGFHGWNPKFENSIWVTKKARMEKSFANGDVYVETDDAQNEVMPLHYMRSVDPSEVIPEDALKEVVNGVTYTPITDLTEDLPKKVIQSLVAKNIPGYKSVANKASVSKDKTYMRFLYNTNTVTLTKGFTSDYTNNKIETIVKPTGSKLTEKDLGDLENIPGKEFDGWYWDNDYKPGTQVKAGDIMPEEDTRIYAKWKSIEKYKVSYYRSEGDDKPLTEEYYNDGDFTHEIPGYEQGKPDPQGKLGSFVGWFYEVSPGLWMPFKQSIPIYTNYRIVGRWQVNNLHLKYDAHASAGGSWKDNDVYEDNNNYTLGVDAIVSKTAHNQLMPPKGMTFSGWRLGFDGDMYYPGNPITMMGNQTLVADYVKEDVKKLTINVYQDPKNQANPQTIVLTEDRKTSLPMNWMGTVAQENKNRELMYWVDSDGQKYNLGESLTANDFLKEGITEINLYGYWEGVLKFDAYGLNNYSFKLGEEGFEDLSPISSSTTLKVTDSRQEPIDWTISVNTTGFTPKVETDDLSLIFGKDKQMITSESVFYKTGKGDAELKGDEIHLKLNANYKDWISSVPYHATLNWSIESKATREYINNPGVGVPRKVGVGDE